MASVSLAQICVRFLQNKMTKIDLPDCCHPPEFPATSGSQDLLFTSDPKRSWIDFYPLEQFHALQYQNISEKSQSSKWPLFIGGQDKKITDAAQLSNVAMVKVRSVS